MKRVQEVVRWAVPVVALGSLAAVGRGQTVTLDEGSYRILVNGKEVGTETFSIRQNGEGADAVIIAHGRVVLDSAGKEQDVSASLQLAGGTLRPMLYDLRQEGGRAERIAGRIMGGRFSARIMSAAGESMREYLVSQGAVIADDGIAHQYYFLARRVGNQSGRVPLVIPRENRQVFAQVEVKAPAPLSVAGQEMSARQLVVTPAGGVVREVWVDDAGRVLRLEIPSRNLVFERTSAP